MGNLVVFFPVVYSMPALQELFPCSAKKHYVEIQTVATHHCYMLIKHARKCASKHVHWRCLHYLFLSTMDSGNKKTGCSVHHSVLTLKQGFIRKLEHSTLS